MKLKPEVLWRCPVCKGVYTTEEDALKCLEQGETPPDPRYPVGTIVVTYGYGWFDGDPAWVRNPELTPTQATRKDSRGYETYQVISAVTKNPYDPHQWVYHLRTASHLHQNRGYTSPRHRWPLEVVENPPALVLEQSKQFLGQSDKNLFY